MLAGLACGAVQAASPTLERIKQNGTMVLSYRNAAPPFSFKDRDGQVRGYSIDLCTRIASAIQSSLGIPNLKVEWVSVEAAERFEAVANGKVDADCGTTTITLARMEKVDFTVPIYVDGGGVLVGTKSKLKRLPNLKGKRIAVIAGTTTERALRTALDTLDSSATMVTVTNSREGMRLLEDGKVDGYAGDRTVLANLKLRSRDPKALDFVAGEYSYEPYGIALRRDDPDFKLAVNRAIVNMYRTGEIDGVFQRWLGALGKPGTLLHAMFYLNTLPE